MIPDSFVDPDTLYLGVRDWHLVAKYVIHNLENGTQNFIQLIIPFTKYEYLNLTYCLDSAVFLAKQWIKYSEIEIVLLICV